MALSLVTVSCKKDKALPDPVAAFSYSASGNYVPVTVTFTSTSQNATSLLWNFGDGVTSALPSPQHIYASAGQYTITLLATNGDGKTNTTTQYLTVAKQVLPMPTVGFAFTGDVTFAPCFATFSNTTTNAATYHWDFGDGTTSTEKTPKHLYAAGGTYTVVLTAANADAATSNLSKQVIVGNAPTKVNVKQLTLLAFPATKPGGSGWDSYSAADPYFIISNYPSTTSFYTSEYLTDVLVTSLPKTFAANNTILAVINEYLFLFKDDDGLLIADEIGGVHFIFNQFMPTDGKAYPSEITITGSTGAISFKLAIEWKP